VPLVGRLHYTVKRNEEVRLDLAHLLSPPLRALAPPNPARAIVTSRTMTDSTRYIQPSCLSTTWMNMAPDHLSSTFSALADPTRREILRRLVEQGDAAVTELAEPFSISLQAVSKHLKVLEKAGLIARERNAQLRLSRVRAAPLREAAEWFDDYRQLWEASFDRLGSRLNGTEDSDG
jgi:DNA-binding transcriptional ArsR family regulator